MQLEPFLNFELLGRYNRVMLDHWHPVLYGKMQYTGVDAGTGYKGGIQKCCSGMKYDFIGLQER